MILQQKVIPLMIFCVEKKACAAKKKKIPNDMVALQVHGLGISAQLADENPAERNPRQREAWGETKPAEEFLTRSTSCACFFSLERVKLNTVWIYLPPSSWLSMKYVELSSPKNKPRSEKL